MFNYTDPTHTGSLEAAGAVDEYRAVMHAAYREFARRPRSSFTMLEAFDEAAEQDAIREDVLTWSAFPRAANVGAAAIDTDRFQRQDEYVEWFTERDTGGRVKRVTFTTEFAEYFEVLAAVGTESIIAEVKMVTGENSVNASDIFGDGFNADAATSSGRAARLREMATRNIWNNAERSILFLTHPSSTLSALLNLLAACGVPKPTLQPNEVCDAVSGACVSARNSDPSICAIVQQLTRAKRGVTLADPAGVTIERLDGIWKLDGREFDMNDPAANHGLWRVERNKRRAVLTVPRQLTIVDDPVLNGTDVATALVVGARVLHTPDTNLPSWARFGQESSRMVSE